MAQIAALLHRAADMTHEPATKEIKYLLPKPALSSREPRPQQWSNMVQQAWNNVQHSSAASCKAQVLGESNIVGKCLSAYKERSERLAD
jgi:myosin-15